MKRWLLIPITTLLVHSIAQVEVLSGEVAFIPQLVHLLRTKEPMFLPGELATSGRSKGESSRREPTSSQPIISRHSIPRGQAAKALLSEANRELKVVKTSRYSHKTQVDEAIGQFNYDCSGFLKYALAHSVPEALRSLQKATVRRPLAKHFVRFITSLPPRQVVGRWSQVERATDLEPGDIIAWIKPPTVASRNTGHVMIVRSAIQRHPKRPHEIIVPVIDSTASRHGHSDSRHKEARTGLGTGSIILVVDDTGKAISYRWSRSQNSRRHTTKIALARLE
jgi:hypothetical protein